MVKVAAEGHPVPVNFIGIRDQFGEVSRMDYLPRKFKMTPDDIVEQAAHAIAMKATAVAGG
jgi:transketolase